MTLHTGPGCSISNNGKSAGRIVTPNCDVNAAGQSSNAGCSIDTSNKASYGAGFNAGQGGVYATEWTSDVINVWFFARSAVPSDISSGNPDPTGWGTPSASFSGACDIDKSIKNQQIVFDTTFCGEWAGAVWSSDPVCSSKASTCEAFVQNNPSAFKDAYWSVNSLKVYQSSFGTSGSSSTKTVASLPTASSNGVSIPPFVSVLSASSLRTSLKSSSAALSQISSEPAVSPTSIPAFATQSAQNTRTRGGGSNTRTYGQNQANVASAAPTTAPTAAKVVDTDDFNSTSVAAIPAPMTTSQTNNTAVAAAFYGQSTQTSSLSPSAAASATTLIAAAQDTSSAAQTTSEAQTTSSAAQTTSSASALPSASRTRDSGRGWSGWSSSNGTNPDSVAAAVTAAAVAGTTPAPTSSCASGRRHKSATFSALDEGDFPGYGKVQTEGPAVPQKEKRHAQHVHRHLLKHKRGTL